MVTYIDDTGPYTLDLALLQGKLVDIEEGGMQGLRPDLSNFQSMALSLAEAMPLHGATAGIPQDVYDHFVLCNDTEASLPERPLVAVVGAKCLSSATPALPGARAGLVVASQAQSRGGRLTVAAAIAAGGAVAGMRGAPFAATFVQPPSATGQPGIVALPLRFERPRRATCSRKDRTQATAPSSPSSPPWWW
jgi:hypothetical protein